MQEFTLQNSPQLHVLLTPYCVMNALTRLSQSVAKLKASLSQLGAKSNQQTVTESHSASAKMQAIKPSEFRAEVPTYVDSGCVNNKYWLVVSLDRDGNSYRVIGRSALGTTLITTIKATDSLYVQATSDKVESNKQTQEQEVTPKQEVAITTSRSGFKAKLGNVMLTCYGHKNVELWQADSEGVYRPFFNLKVARQLLQQIADKVTPKRLERALTFLQSKAWQRGISPDKLAASLPQLQA